MADDDVSRETSHAGALQDGDSRREAVLDAIQTGFAVPLSDAQRRLLGRYERWLADEAGPAGGVGPGESNRLFDRHIADSLAFLAGITRPCGSVLDVGSGVGLPGIPLAIALPESHVTLLDRAGRRVGLARRAVRVLGLTNVAVLEADVSAVRDRFDVAVFRASLPIAPAAETLAGVVHPDGYGLVGVSRRSDRPEVPEPPPGVAFELSSWGSGVLDSPFWLLRMRITHID